MKNEEYTYMYTVEDHHWWFRGKRTILTSLLRRYVDSRKRVLDYGCGTGALLSELQNDWDVEGVDTSHQAVSFAQKRGVQSVTRIDELWQPTSVYDAIIASDVVEHIADDKAVLAKLWQALAPGGVLIVTVPAFSWLWSSHDEVLHHYRRYTTKMLRRHGGAITWSFVSYYNIWLFPFAVIVRVLHKLFGTQHAASDSARIPPRWINKVLFWIFQSEKYLVGRIPLPFGLSVIGVAIKT